MENVNAIEDKNSESTTSVQYIVVKIGNEQYGIDIKYIDNIVRSQNITRVPKTQSYYKGVINLRGEICPIMSMRLKLGLEPDELTDKTRFIIVKVEGHRAGVHPAGWRVRGAGACPHRDLWQHPEAHGRFFCL